MYLRSKNKIKQKNSSNVVSSCSNMATFGQSHEHLSTTKQHGAQSLLNPLIQALPFAYWVLTGVKITQNAGCLPEEEKHNRFLTLSQFHTRMTPSTPLYPAVWSCTSYKPICAPKALHYTSKTHTRMHTHIQTANVNLT